MKKGLSILIMSVLFISLFGCATKANYQYVEKDNDASLTMVAEAKRMIVNYWISFDKKKCANSQYTGYLLDLDTENQNALVKFNDSIDFLVKEESFEIKNAIPSGNEIQIIASGRLRDRGARTCGQLIDRFVPEAGKRYHSVFHRTGDACYLELLDVTNPQAPIKVPRTSEIDC